MLCTCNERKRKDVDSVFGYNVRILFISGALRPLIGPIMSRKLPAEITESIIDCLYDDKATLKNCALTHRSWLHRSRHHLHKSVSIDSNTADQKLSGYYATGAAAHIEDLTLIAAPQPYGVHRRGSMSQRAKPVWQIASRFSNITSLTLVFFNWRGAYKSYDRIAEISRHVTHLSLVIATFDDVVDFLSFLAVFPKLSSLSVSSLSFGCATSWGAGYSLHSDDGLAHLLEAPATPYLHTLRLANTHPCEQVAQQLGQWLSALPKQFVPKSSLTWTGAGSVHGLVQSLRGFGANLAHLEIDAPSASQLAYEGQCFSPYSSATAQLTRRVLSADNAVHDNTSLETITFRDMQYIAREEVQWVRILLTQISSPSFHKVHFVCTSSCFEGVDEHSLEVLDEFLAMPAFAALEEVALTFASTLRQKDLAVIVKRALHHADERGILRTTFPVPTIDADKVL